MSKYFNGCKSWSYVFTTYCPNTNTGLWWGVTKKQRKKESQMRENLYKYNTWPPGGSPTLVIFDCFIKNKLSNDLLREFVEMMDDKDRHLLEDTVWKVLIKKDPRPQNCVINCINYVKLGLVKYFEELNQVIKIKGE